MECKLRLEGAQEGDLARRDPGRAQVLARAYCAFDQAGELLDLLSGDAGLQPAKLSSLSKKSSAEHLLFESLKWEARSCAFALADIMRSRGDDWQVSHSFYWQACAEMGDASLDLMLEAIPELLEAQTDEYSSNHDSFILEIALKGFRKSALRLAKGAFRGNAPARRALAWCAAAGDCRQALEALASDPEEPVDLALPIDFELLSPEEEETSGYGESKRAAVEGAEKVLRIAAMEFVDEKGRPAGLDREKISPFEAAVLAQSGDCAGWMLERDPSLLAVLEKMLQGLDALRRARSGAGGELGPIISFGEKLALGKASPASRQAAGRKPGI